MKWRNYLLVAILLMFYCENTEENGAHFGLYAKWEKTNFFLECAEFIGSIDNDLYFRFIDEYYSQIIVKNEENNVENFRIFETEKEEVDFFINIAEKVLITEEYIKLLHLSLSTRFYSPAVKAHWFLFYFLIYYYYYYYFILKPKFFMFIFLLLLLLLLFK